MIQSVIFDMDGLLVDSEPFWGESEILVFSNYGIDIQDNCTATRGMRVDEVVRYWSTKFPNQIDDIQKVANEILEEVKRLVIEKGVPMKGAIQALELFANKGMGIALASSSAMSLINVVIDKLHIRKYLDVIMSAENLQYGKPHPEIFLETAKRLQTAPGSCLVLEDSIAGVIAGKAAQMKVIAVPDAALATRKEYFIADAQLHSLDEIDENLINQFNER